MNRTLKPTSQYKRDLKHFKHDRKLISDLTQVIADLAADIPLALLFEITTFTTTGKVAANAISGLILC